jgi:hypothetical protein
MLNESTISKLHEMKLSVMAKTLHTQMGDIRCNDMAFEERLGLIVDAEWVARKNNRLTRLIRNAGYDLPDACVEDIEYHPERKLDKTLITRLATCQYIEERHNVIIMGATGNGKTYIANALGMSASRSFYTVKYIAEDIEHNADGTKLRGLSKNQICIGVATDKKHTIFLVEGTGKPSQKKTYDAFKSHIEPKSRLNHDKESAQKKLVKLLDLDSVSYASKDVKGPFRQT